MAGKQRGSRDGSRSGSRSEKKIRYAVVGQGYISQIAVLPAFRNASRNCELGALVSDNLVKLRKLGRKYGVKALYTYEQYDDMLRSGDIDAVYIALPNHLHYDYAVRACKAGVHVLCEKPMATTSAECEEMIRSAREADVKLMVGYRLHFEETNLTAAEELAKGRIGEPRIFNSAFSIAVDPKNYRASPRSEGGGPTFDVGIYCLNAARYLFRDEPVEVSAMGFGVAREGSDAEETMTVSLRFKGGQAANFVCSMAAFPNGHFHVVGTKGVLSVENAYEHAGPKTMRIETRSGTRSRKFKARDQFAPELIYFSDCILRNQDPEPSGLEGLIDVRIIEAIFESAESGRAVRIEPLMKDYPGMEQEITAPEQKEPELVEAEEPTKEEAA